MPKKTLSEKGLDGGGWIVMNKYLQVETRDSPVWCDSVFFAVGECNYGSIGSQKITYPDEEHATETLAVSLASEIIEVPVIQTQEKTQQVMNTHVQYVVDTVEVEKSKIFEETVQRIKPIIQEKISQVIKHTDFPQLQFLSKVVDMPVVGQQQASMVEKIQTTIHVPQAQVVEKTVEIPVLQIIKKAIEIPENRTVWGTETSESLDTARIRQNDVRSKRQQHEQQHHNNQQQSTRQAMQQHTGERGKKEGELRKKGTRRLRRT